MSDLTLVKKLDEYKKLIKYYESYHQEMTGREFPSYSKLGDLLGDKSILDELKISDPRKEEEEKKANNIEKLMDDKNITKVN
jgi:hypothetical protein